MLNQNEEELLDIILKKFNDNNYDIILDHNEYPDYMKFSIKDYLNRLKAFGLISYFSVFITNGCHIVLTPLALQYFNKKGGRKELFNELSKNEKNLLKEIIEANNNGENIVELLKKKLENDKDDINREMIGLLKRNGLLTLFWADDTILEAKLTNNGKTFFEREKEFKEEMKNNSTYINAQNSNIFMGNIVNSSISINSTIDTIRNNIETRCVDEEEKRELMDLLEEAKEILENYDESKHIPKRKSFFKKLLDHLDRHGWFYAEIINLFGQFVLTKISGQ